MLDPRISHVRSFNRLVSQTIGALHDHYLGRDRPLAEARLLFEIGRNGADVKDLRARLGLDSGYLSRLLRSLEQQGLTTTPQTLHDKRIRHTALTSAGIAELEELDRRSDRLAQSMLDPLSETQQTSLIKAMVEVERLLSAAAVTIGVESPASEDAQYCLGEYFRELALRFENGFEPAKSLAPTATEFVPPKGAFLIVRLNGKPIGCGAFKRLPPDIGYFKRMWIAQDARGLGLGRRLLQALEDYARSAGCAVVQLETQKSLTEAQQLYKRCGYHEVAPFNDEFYAHHWFEKSFM